MSVVWSLQTWSRHTAVWRCLRLIPDQDHTFRPHSTIQRRTLIGQCSRWRALLRWTRFPNNMEAEEEEEEEEEEPVAGEAVTEAAGPVEVEPAEVEREVVVVRLVAGRLAAAPVVVAGRAEQPV